MLGHITLGLESLPAQGAHDRPLCVWPVGEQMFLDGRCRGESLPAFRAAGSQIWVVGSAHVNLE